ncbi:hypothetical protein A6M27_16610 [Acidithiobacillus thiooxidans]|uniref:Uncharacterized protein n=1 Tax=Acidithiobacillus thiooxidans TaxID=930 RepID=A0A1C2HVN3_ACITH|nr:hypothetical protein [Acidithiobacillus thiooxidans]OCX67808.1 hypothetical protein A6P07_19300 [Acidithiobacillus thiooxidans]OCX84147.1 hypothetical protein A6M27_16610 [Acidithiobacillus thiooxidans]OCX85792.1 hypothetical protein A6O26_00165 [Acidithiobacillus thiooxidans]OFC48525.1 hypothetical protein BAE47_07475 [Acidithiobacillus thiooxidans]
MEQALRDGIQDVLNQKTRVKQIQDEIKESVLALAERFDMKPARLNKIINLVDKEQSRGGVIEAEREILTDAEDAAR